MNQNSEPWYLYMIRTPQGQLYTGITKNVAQRFKQHQAGKGARYLRGKSPLELVYHVKVGAHSEALKLELQTKKLSKAEKEALITDPIL